MDKLLSTLEKIRAHIEAHYEVMEKLEGQLSDEHDEVIETIKGQMPKMKLNERKQYLRGKLLTKYPELCALFREYHDHIDAIAFEVDEIKDKLEETQEKLNEIEELQEEIEDRKRSLD